jgi:hypothetical protein
MKKNSKKKKVAKKKAVKTFNKKKKLTGDYIKDTLAVNWLDYINRQYKPLSKAKIKEIEKEKKERKIAELKEQKRRAKKITMTVGEYEDAIERAKHLEQSLKETLSEDYQVNELGYGL